MSGREIHVVYDPRQDHNTWKVSYGEPVGCFRVSKQRTAIYYAVKVARRIRPCRLIVFNQQGNIEKQIEFPYGGKEKLLNRINRYYIRPLAKVRLTGCGGQQFSGCCFRRLGLSQEVY